MERSLIVTRMGTVDYAAATALQDALVRARQSDAIGDTLLLLEHPHVFTLGRGASESFLLERIPGVPIHRVSRGGEVTYHGPGQLVGYPIIKLEGAARDIGKYLRALERVLINALGAAGIAAEQRDGLTGVWVSASKIAKIGSIGVGIRRWVTFHGFALNVAPELSYFDAMVPCGIAGCEMTSIAALGNTDATVDGFATLVESAFVDVFGYDRAITADADSIRRLVDHPALNCEA